MIKMYPDHMTLAANTKEAKNAFAKGKIASMVGIEGGYSIEEDLSMIKSYFDLGVCYMTLT